MFADLRYSVRSLARRPSFVAAALLVLGLAVGVNTAVFSLINSLLLRPLPVRAPHELAFVYGSDDRRLHVSYEALLRLRDALDVFDGLAARVGDTAGLRVGNVLVPLHGEAVTANYFDVLGVTPRIGRTFQPSEESASATPVAIISEAMWKSQFAADGAIVGRTLRITGPPANGGRYSASRDYTIVGVMGSAFRGTGNAWQPTDYWVPLAQRYEDHRAARGGVRTAPLSEWPVLPIGRLRSGVTFAQAQAAVNTAGRDVIRQTWRDRVRPEDTYVLLNAPRVRLPFAGAYFLSVPRLALALMAIATLLMAIAAMNLAGMLLARGVARRTEMAVRLSLGASRARLVRQLLAESLILAVCGTAAGLLIARLLVVMALREIPRQMPGVNATTLAVDVPVDARVFAFACLTCLVTALLVGASSAAASVRGNLSPALTSSGILAPRVARSRMRRLVLVPQIALSLVLLLVSGVMVRSLLRLEMAPAGYDPEHVVILQLQLPASPRTDTDDHVAEGERVTAVFDRVVERIASLAEVSSVAVSEMSIQGVGLPEMGTTVIARSIDGSRKTPKGATFGLVSPAYFETMGIALIRGRPFDARDMRKDARTAIVSERLANELWPGTDPIGQALSYPYSPASRYPARWYEVIGVAKSATLPLDEFPRPVFYVPITSQPLMASNILVRGSGNPARLIARATEAIAQADDTVLVSQARPLADAVAAVRSPRRFSAALLGASGVAGLILAALGVFGLMSYAVAQRVGEIGVRMVLGARRPDVIRLVLFEAVGVVIAGIVIGFALAFAALRYVSHAVVPLPNADAGTFIVVPLILIASVVLACFFPARRAASVDPLIVLKHV